MSIKESPSIFATSSLLGHDTEIKFIPITFWYHLIEGGTLKRNQDSSEYEPNLKCIGSCDNIKDFWQIFQHIKKPSNLVKNYDFQIFKKDIKPMWEEPSNKNGGKLSLYVTKEYSSLIWEEIVFAFAGGVIPFIDEINGISFSSRKNMNVLQIWFKLFNKELIYKMRDDLKDFFQIPFDVNIPSKPFSLNPSSEEIEV